ncbi:hypothetical protein [Streptacidiphilus cavernicola]|uniref:Uncharacterized protein n=1 Tax=Streptacidiphilus cavernicola TaxID=3342716 RepID=A0ABV6VWV7_9ACTN
MRQVALVVHTLRVSRGPVASMRCVAQTTVGNRCLRSIGDGLEPAKPISMGIPSSASGNQLADRLADTPMMVYDWTHLSYEAGIRLAHQHCSFHGLNNEAVMAPSDWENFDALLHEAYIVRPDGWVPPRDPRKRSRPLF